MIETKLTQSAFADKAGVSRQNISSLIKKGLLIKEDGKLNIENETNKFYLQQRKENPRIITNPGNAKKKTTSQKKPIKKVSRETKTVKKKPAVKKQEESENTEDTQDNKDEPLTMQKQRLEIEKLKEQRDKLKLENEKSRGLLCETETLGQALIGYCIALNKNLLDQPRSFIDEFEASLKMGKSKTELTDILRIPASQAIKSSIDIMKKEVKKYKRAVRLVEKLEDD